MKKVDKDSYSWKQRITDNLFLPSFTTMRLARNLGQLVARAPFESDALLVHVSNKLKLSDRMIEREKTFPGRIINKLFGEDVELIVLDGIVVKQIHEFVGDEPTRRIDLKSSYETHHDDVRKLHDRLEDTLASGESGTHQRDKS